MMQTPVFTLDGVSMPLVYNAHPIQHPVRSSNVIGWTQRGSSGLISSDTVHHVCISDVHDPVPYTPQQPHRAIPGPALDVYEGDFEEVDFIEAAQRYGRYIHVVHVMIYSKPPAQSPNILMLLNEHGLLVFPGGHLEPFDNSILDGLKRELREELNIILDMTQDDHLFSTINHRNRSVGHLYGHEVVDGDLLQIIKASGDAIHFRKEVFGTVNVQVHKTADGFYVLPEFNSQDFIEPFRMTLYKAIQRLHLV